MPGMMEFTIQIDGKRYPHWHRLNVEQSMEAVHTFELHLGDSWLMEEKDTTLSVVESFLGKPVTIHIKPPGQQPSQLLFTGEVTSVATGRATNASHGICILKGKSQEAKLERVTDVQAFESQTLKEIVDKMTKEIPGIRIQPVNTKPCPFHVQYGESVYAFLRRLAAVHGEWFFNNGQSLLFGQYTAAHVRLKYREQLQQFEIRSAVPPSPPVCHRYNQTSGAVEQGSPQFHAQGSLLGAAVRQVQAAGQLHTIREPAAVAAQLAAGLQAEALQFQGESTCHEIRPGHIVLVEEGKRQRHGAFRIRRITHRCRGDGSYSNLIEGIDESIGARYLSAAGPPPCYPQSAVVTDTNDPEQLGRVRVRFHWQHGNATPWIHVIHPHAGDGKGVYFLPEPGELVWVAFMDNHPEYPYVCGTCYSAKASPDFSATDNNIKLIRTRSGHTITLDDSAAKEKIVITDKSGNLLQLDTAGKSITLEAPEMLTIKAGNIRLHAREGISLHAGNDVALAAAGNIMQHATRDVLISAANTDIITDKRLSIQAEDARTYADKLQLKSLKGNLELHAAKTLDLQSEERIRLY